jgi:uncharacterized protein with HEPN domain
MTRHDDATRLRHMLDHSVEAVEMAHGRKREDLDADRQFSLALTRLMEIIGEAAAKVSDAVRQGLPGIPWQDVVGMRNRLIHGYDEVDLQVLWDVVQIDLPELIRELRSSLPQSG